MRCSSYPVSPIFQACLPIKYYKVWWRLDKNLWEPPLNVKMDNKPWSNGKNKQEVQALAPVQVTFLFLNSCTPQPGPRAWSPYLPVTAILHRAIQISCPRWLIITYSLANGGSWRKLGLYSRACWRIETLVKSTGRKQLIRVSFYMATSWNAKATRF